MKNAFVYEQLPRKHVLYVLILYTNIFSVQYSYKLVEKYHVISLTLIYPSHTNINTVLFDLHCEKPARNHTKVML